MLDLDESVPNSLYGFITVEEGERDRHLLKNITTQMR